MIASPKCDTAAPHLPPLNFMGDVLCRVSDKFRMKYSIKPGLYRIGNPSQESNVLVTANYRLTCNHVRKAMENRNVHVLVLNTRGINVWCAAGKGTFCTAEIVRQLTASDLGSKVSHRTLILPQLSASGVNASKLHKASGFTIKFGPIRASDIPAYLDNNFSATPDMRRVRFSIVDRAKLVPMEAVPALKTLGVFLLIAAILFGITRTGIIFKQALAGVWPIVVAGLTSVFTGSGLPPLLLPFIPGRAFSFKGFCTGLIGAVAVFLFLQPVRTDVFLAAFCLVAMPAFSSYQAFLFTGSTTFTSPSGVKAELKIALPLYLAGAGISLVLFAAALYRFWRFS
ncbi:MAG TPA: mercury methylation corrinoid protein HgcA [Chitinivibrionales bacterium]|nr:mercury methylation corrinoid protein HgcA [Chitinivibrionales bacterium]